MTMRLLRRQSGEGKVPLIIGILVVAGVIYGLTLSVPPRIQKAEFADFMESKGRAYVTNQITRDMMESSILEEAQKTGVPLRPEGLQITDAESRLTLKATYDVEKKLIGGKVWVQHYEIEREVPKI